MHPLEKIIYPLGRPFSPLYALAMKIRAACYAKGVLRRYRAAVPVISIGNLTMGGTGKTPAVISVCLSLQQWGYRPAVISRGYGGRPLAPVNIVSDGTTIFLPAGICGDEPRLLAEALPGVVVITAKKRSLGAQAAIKKYQCDILVLDDGFQHLAMARDLDIVLLTQESPLGNGRVFPGGPLREPCSALARADLLVVTSFSASTAHDTRVTAQKLTALFHDKKTVSDHGIRCQGLAHLPSGKRLQCAGDARHRLRDVTGVQSIADNTADSVPCNRLQKHPCRSEALRTEPDTSAQEVMLAADITKPLFSTGYQAIALRGMDDGGAVRRLPLDYIAGKKIFLFCGIGSPEGFVTLAGATKSRLAGSRFFRDHHRYTAADIRELMDAARGRHADVLLTTAKDYVKLTPSSFGPMELLALDVRLHLDAAFLRRLQQSLKRIAS